jgi:Bifunctional DNA primase/polymerase, N-terminal
MTALLEAATDYAERDWPVFPLRPGQKTPLIAKRQARTVGAA